MQVIVNAVLTGIVITLVGTIPRNVLFYLNLRVLPEYPWAVPVLALYMWLFWRYLNGAGPPSENAENRRNKLRAWAISPKAWAWSLTAGLLSLVSLVFALRLANRFVALPVQTFPDFHVSRFSIVSLLLASAPVAGIIEESAFRGYMQGPIERRLGLPLAILITGTMFALVHLDFTPILWPYYVAVAAIYGTVAYLNNSILPAIALHTLGNLYSNFDLYLHGQAEWQAPAAQAGLIGRTGLDEAFWVEVAGLVVSGLAAVWAFGRLRVRSTVRQGASPAA